MITLNERQKEIKKIFNSFSNWEDKYKKIIDMGKKLPAFPDEMKNEKNLVKGCQSKVWFNASMSDQKKMILKADSDALIVKGLISILLYVYSNSSLDEILNSSEDFLKEIGFSDNLSPSRTNGLYSMIKQIKYYAKAYKLSLNF